MKVFKELTLEILGRSLFEIIQQRGLPTPKSVLQVGANTGQEIEGFYKAGIKQGIFIEPLEIPFQMLSARCRGKADFIPVQALALAEDNLLAPFYIASNGGESSSILSPKKHLDWYPTVSFDKPAELLGQKVDTLSDICKKKFENLPDAYELFFIDVQGAELEVMKGAINQLQKGKYVFSEVGDGGGYEGDVRLADLMIYLRLFGLKPLALEINNASGYGNALWYKP
jgi:FkbM family methyltransferase